MFMLKLMNYYSSDHFQASALPIILFRINMLNRQAYSAVSLPTGKINYNFIKVICLEVGLLSV